MVGAWAALVGLAGARVGRRAGALLAVALGVAAAAGAVLASSPLSLVSRQSAMEKSLRAAPPAERALRVAVVRDAGGPASLDATARDVLRGSAFAAGEVRAVRFGGRPAGRLPAARRAEGSAYGTLGSVVLTGVDSISRWVSLSSGRLPRSCVPAACEVVAVGGGRRLPREFAFQRMRMRVVGHGRLDGVPLGAVPPRSGSVDSAASFVVASGVTIAGQDVSTHSREQLAQLRARAVAVVPQVSALVAGLSALDNVALGLRARGESTQDVRTRAYEALEAVDLHELAKRLAGGLSGGERQRVALARALATNAPLIVADEPTANLDEANAIKVAELLAERARNGACIVCATHDASVTARASAVIAMRDGRVAPGAGGAQAPPAIA